MHTHTLMLLRACTHRCAHLSHAFATQDAITVFGKPYGTHQLLKFRTGPVIVSVGSGLATLGYTLMADESVAGELFATLVSKVCVLCVHLDPLKCVSQIACV